MFKGTHVTIFLILDRCAGGVLSDSLLKIHPPKPKKSLISTEENHRHQTNEFRKHKKY